MTVPLTALTARTTGRGDARCGDDAMDGVGFVGVGVDVGGAFVITATLEIPCDDGGGTGDELVVGDRADCCEGNRGRSSGLGDVCGELRDDRSARDPRSEPRVGTLGLP